MYSLVRGSPLFCEMLFEIRQLHKRVNPWGCMFVYQLVIALIKRWDGEKGICLRDSLRDICVIRYSKPRNGVLLFFAQELSWGEGRHLFRNYFCCKRGQRIGLELWNYPKLCYFNCVWYKNIVNELFLCAFVQLYINYQSYSM